MPVQSVLEFGDELRGAVWDVLFGFREVKRAGIVVARAYIQHHDGWQTTTQSTNAQRVEEPLI